MHEGITTCRLHDSSTRQIMMDRDKTCQCWSVYRPQSDEYESPHTPFIGAVIFLSARYAKMAD